MASAIERVDVGILPINSETAGADPHGPFGGVKESGFGPKEQGAAAREFFTTSKTVYLRAAPDHAGDRRRLTVRTVGRDFSRVLAPMNSPGSI